MNDMILMLILVKTGMLFNKLIQVPEVNEVQNSYDYI